VNNGDGKIWGVPGAVLDGIRDLPLKMGYMIKLKRVYEKPDRGDGVRILVDRLWPRGISKEKGKIDLWLKKIAPSDGLRKWFQHKEERSAEFKKRYYEELRSKKELTDKIAALSRKGTVTLVYAAKDDTINNATALREFMIKK
jgi:uncharacterized protein YeaO (DUF488 family)